jgi:hypothetical protein
LVLGQSVADILDLAQPDLPLLAEKTAVLDAGTARFEEVLGAFRQLAASAAPDLERGVWFSEAWLADRARNAGRAFDRAFDLGGSSTAQPSSSAIRRGA